MFKHISSFYKAFKIFRIKYEADMKIANILFNKTFIAGGFVSGKGVKTSSIDYLTKPEKPFDKMDMESVGKRMEEIFKDIEPLPQTKYGKDYMKG